MHSIEVIEANIVLNYPENAQELNREQTLAFSRLLLLYHSAKLSYQQFRVRFTYNLLNLKRTADITNSTNDAVIDNVNRIAQLADSFFTDERKEGKTVKMIKMDFIMQKQPTVTVDNKKFYGPTDALFNTVYGEYLQLITHFNAYSASSNEADLDKMIATIYRPKKQWLAIKKRSVVFDGDTRKKFNSNLTARYAKTLSKLPFHFKYAIYLYVASSQHFIINSDALDIGNGNTIDLTVLFNATPNNTSGNSLGMVGTLYSLAETNVFGNADDVATKNTYDILTFLATKTEEYNKLKAKNNATTT